MAEELTIHQQMLENIRHPLIIALVRRLMKPGDELCIPVDELREVAMLQLMIRYDPKTEAYYFTVERSPAPPLVLEPKPNF